MANDYESEHPGSILVVDDMLDNLHLLSDILRRYGYCVQPLTEGSRVVESVLHATPDLILLDVMMSDMNGYEVCECLKADQRMRDIPVIFISALTDVADKVKGFAVGGVDYITKPFQKDEVLYARQNPDRLAKNAAAASRTKCTCPRKFLSADERKKRCSVAIVNWRCSIRLVSCSVPRLNLIMYCSQLYRRFSVY